MNDNPSEPGWDDLARELGADPPPEAFERHQPSSPASPSPVAEKPSPVELPKPVASDWNLLADSLGLEVPPAESAPAKKKSSPKEHREDFGSEDQQGSDESALPELHKESASEDLGWSSADQLESQSESASSEMLGPSSGSDPADDALDSDLDSDLDEGISGEEARDAFESLFEEGPPAEGRPATVDAGFAAAERVVSEIEFTEIPAGETTEPAEEQEAGPPKKRRRPRRRGRGRPRGEKPTEEQDSAVSEQMVSGQEAAAAIAREDLIDKSVEEDQGAAEGRQEQETGADDGERKPRRRRSRRRRREPSKDAAAESQTVEPTLDEIVEEPDDDLIDIDGEEDFDSEETESGTAKKRPSHRNIPTWSEATSVIVESNLQQRSKSPSKAKSGSGRGRGRGRGGRRKKT